MSIQLYDSLKIAEKEKALPKVIAYNRIDGPGSSLDLSEFQQAFWKLPDIKDKNDPARKWTINLPRTVGITIDTGTEIVAHPFNPDLIGVKSVEYETEVIACPGEVVPIAHVILHVRPLRLARLHPDRSAVVIGLDGPDFAHCALANAFDNLPMTVGVAHGQPGHDPRHSAQSHRRPPVSATTCLVHGSHR